MQSCYWSILLLLGNENDHANADSNNIIFTIKDTKWYVPVITLLAKDNQKLPILVSKGFERLVYWNEYKTKSWNKNTTNECRYLTEANFLRVNRLFVLTDPNEDASVKRFSGKKYYLPKGNIKNCNVIVNGKNFCGTIPGQKKLKKILGVGLRITKYCWPSCSDNKENVSFQIFNNGLKDVTSVEGR